jgi:hypothetical protein
MGAKLVVYEPEIVFTVEDGESLFPCLPAYLGNWRLDWSVGLIVTLDVMVAWKEIAGTTIVRPMSLFLASTDEEWTSRYY